MFMAVAFDGKIYIQIIKLCYFFSCDLDLKWNRLSSVPMCPDDYYSEIGAKGSFLVLPCMKNLLTYSIIKDRWKQNMTLKTQCY